MANERCPKCGEPLTNFNRGGELVFDCHYDPKDCRIIELERLLSEAQSLAKQRGDDNRALRLKVIALRAALGAAVDHIGLIDGDSESLGFVAKTRVLLPGLKETLVNTSATTAAVRAEIEREALEKAFDRVNGWIDKYQPKALCTSPRLANEELRAAILGTQQEKQ